MPRLQFSASSPSSQKLAGGCGAVFVGLFMTVWITIWIGAIGFAAVAAFPEAKLAVRSGGFPQTRGRMLRCEVETIDGGGDGDSYKLDLEYAYEANGREFVGTRYDTAVAASDDRDWYRAKAAELKPGTVVPVFYDPDAPATAMLVPGVTGAHLFVVLFALPFLAIAAVVLGGMLSYPIKAAVGARTGRCAASIPLPRGLTALATGIGVMGAVGFAGVFLVGFTVGFRPPLWLPTGILIVGAGLAGAAAAKVYRTPRSEF